MVEFEKLKTRNDVLRYEMSNDGRYIIFHHSGDWYTAMNVSAWVCEAKLGIKNKRERYQYDEAFKINVKLLAKRDETFDKTVREPMEKLGAKLVHKGKDILVFENPIKVEKQEILKHIQSAEEQEKTIESLLMPDRVSPEKARRIVDIYMEVSSAIAKDLPNSTKDSVGEKMLYLVNCITADDIQVAIAQDKQEREKWKRQLIVDVQVFAASLMGVFNAGMLPNKRAMKIGKMLRDILHENR